MRKTTTVDADCYVRGGACATEAFHSRRLPRRLSQAAGCPHTCVVSQAQAQPYPARHLYKASTLQQPCSCATPVGAGSWVEQMEASFFLPLRRCASNGIICHPNGHPGAPAAQTAKCPPHSAPECHFPSGGSPLPHAAMHIQDEAEQKVREIEEAGGHADAKVGGAAEETGQVTGQVGRGAPPRQSWAGRPSKQSGRVGEGTAKQGGQANSQGG